MSGSDCGNAAKIDISVTNSSFLSQSMPVMWHDYDISFPTNNDQ